jgi:hypothetical protein
LDNANVDNPQSLNPRPVLVHSLKIFVAIQLAPGAVARPAPQLTRLAGYFDHEAVGETHPLRGSAAGF